DGDVESERIADEKQLHRPADAGDLELAVECDEIATGGEALERHAPVLAPCGDGEPGGRLRTAGLPQGTVERRLVDPAAGQEPTGRGRRRQLGHLLEVERRAQPQDDE